MNEILYYLPFAITVMIIYSFFIYYFCDGTNRTCVVIPLYYFDAKIERTPQHEIIDLPCCCLLLLGLSKAIYVRILIG